MHTGTYVVDGFCVFSQSITFHTAPTSYQYTFYIRSSIFVHDGLDGGCKLKPFLE